MIINPFAPALASFTKSDARWPPPHGSMNNLDTLSAVCVLYAGDIIIEKVSIAGSAV